MALIQCKECGKEISNTAKKCPYCGYERIICKECGEEILDINKPCSNCGYKNANGTLKRVKKAGAITVLIANSIIVIIIALLLLSALAPTEKNQNYKEPNGLVITVGLAEQENILEGTFHLILNWLFMLAPIGLTIISILFIVNKFKNKKLYGVLSLIISIIYMGVIIVFISKEQLGCCYIVFAIFPITSIIGSILTLVEYIGEKNEV